MCRIEVGISPRMHIIHSPPCHSPSRLLSNYPSTTITRSLAPALPTHSAIALSATEKTLPSMAWCLLDSYLDFSLTGKRALAMTCSLTHSNTVPTPTHLYEPVCHCVAHAWERKKEVVTTGDIQYTKTVFPLQCPFDTKNAILCQKHHHEFGTFMLKKFTHIKLTKPRKPKQAAGSQAQPSPPINRREKGNYDQIFLCQKEGTMSRHIPSGTTCWVLQGKAIKLQTKRARQWNYSHRARNSFLCLHLRALFHHSHTMVSKSLAVWPACWETVRKCS